MKINIQGGAGGISTLECLRQIVHREARGKLNIYFTIRLLSLIQIKRTDPIIGTQLEDRVGRPLEEIEILPGRDSVIRDIQGEFYPAGIPGEIGGQLPLDFRGPGKSSHQFLEISFLLLRGQLSKKLLLLSVFIAPQQFFHLEDSRAVFVQPHIYPATGGGGQRGADLVKLPARHSNRHLPLMRGSADGGILIGVVKIYSAPLLQSQRVIIKPDQKGGE